MKPGERSGNADGRAGHEEDALDRAARRAHGAQDGDVVPLVLHQHDQAGDDVERRDQDDQRQDQEHDIALDRERGEKSLVALLPGLNMRSPGPTASSNAGQHFVDLLGLVDHHLDGARRRIRRRRNIPAPRRAACR